MHEVVDRQEIFLACSALLAYPSHPAFFSMLEKIIDMGIPELAATAKGLVGMDAMEREVHYVTLFDFQEKTALFLTAHEYGDDRERGPALLVIKEKIEQSGCFIPDAQLPDYLPLLLEWLASHDDEEIEHRVGQMAHFLLQAVDQEEIYRPLFSFLQRQCKIKEDIVSPKQENPDLEELPYPCDYASEEVFRC
nr:nitrate reductase molybdenum cofactor assembly chaperone [Bacilli bacterium]